MKAVQMLVPLHGFADYGDEEMIAALLAKVEDIDAFRDILSALRDAVDVEIARRYVTAAATDGE